jgi:hypothetical protein
VYWERHATSVAPGLVAATLGAAAVGVAVSPGMHTASPMMLRAVGVMELGLFTAVVPLGAWAAGLFEGLPW